MKKLVSLFGMVAVCASAPVFATDKGDWVNHMFNEADTDKNSYIDKDEYMTHSENKFDEMDANNDGKLSKNEVVAFKKDSMAAMKAHKGKAMGDNAANKPDSAPSKMERSDTSEDSKTNSQSSSH